MLSMLDNGSIVCGDPPVLDPHLGMHTSGGTSHSEQLLQELSKRTCSNGRVSDSDVQQLLRQVFGSVEAQSRKSSTAPTPYIHTRQSLQIMHQIACCTMHQLGSELNTHMAHPCTPVLLSGDTGTGKTYLLFKYLVRLTPL